MNLFQINSNKKGESPNGAFPLMMDSIFAQVIVADVNNDGDLEIIACDTNSNVVCFNLNGEEIWEYRIYGYPNQVSLHLFTK